MMVVATAVVEILPVWRDVCFDSRVAVQSTEFAASFAKVLGLRCDVSICKYGKSAKNGG